MGCELAVIESQHILNQSQCDLASNDMKSSHTQFVSHNYYAVIVVVFILALCSSQRALSQAATIAGDSVIIPTLIVDNAYYTLHLTVAPNTNNENFYVSLAEINPNPILENASILTSSLMIVVPHLSYGGASYSAEFVIASQDPLVIKLNSVALNTSIPSNQNPGSGNNIELSQLPGGAGATSIVLESFSESLWSQYRDLGFQSMLEITVGEDCTNSDAAHFRLEALSKQEIILNSQGAASFNLSDFDKVDVFYSEPGRPTTQGGTYCPPASSFTWTRLREVQTRDSNSRITLLDFTQPPDPHDKYHAANYGGLIYDFYTSADQFPFPLTTSTKYAAQQITDLNIQVSTNDNGTHYNDGTLNSLNDDTATATISVSFDDYDGSQVSVTGVVSAAPGNAQVHTPLLPPGNGINGCWLNKGTDAWCFYGSTGQYIEYSVNGNPGTLYVDFNYSVDLESRTITSRNTYIRLRGSCCDSEEAITNGTSQSASYQLDRNKFQLGGREYIYTDSNLGI